MKQIAAPTASALVHAVNEIRAGKDTCTWEVSPHDSAVLNIKNKRGEVIGQVMNQKVPVEA